MKKSKLLFDNYERCRIFYVKKKVSQKRLRVNSCLG